MRRFRNQLFILGMAWIATILIGAAVRPWLPLTDPLNVDLAATLSPPGAQHWMGTDELGRDLLARLLAAARVTLTITFGATLMNLILGGLLGGIAGFLGGWWDAVLSFFIDLFWSVPFLIFGVLIVSVVGVSSMTLILTIGLINWVTAARIVRAQTQRLRELEFVRTARAFGYSESSVLLREIFPNLRVTMLALSAFSAVEVLTLETGLAFLGLSLPEPTPTWGGLLASGLSYLASGWWITLFTAGLIVVTLASLQIMSRGPRHGPPAGVEMNIATQANLNFYDSFAPLYPAIYSVFDTGAIVAQWLRLLEDEGLVAQADRRADQRLKLLDAACGPGNFLAAWAANGFEVTGVDFSPTMLRLAAEEWKRLHPDEPSRLVRADLCEPDSLRDLWESFDLAVSHSHLPNLFHPEDVPALFQSVSKCLRRGAIWALDHSRIVRTLPIGEDEHAITPTARLLRICDYDPMRNQCTQSWKGDGFEGQENYWFPEIDELDTIAFEYGLSLRRRMEWKPNQADSPFIPLQTESERLFTVYQLR